MALLEPWRAAEFDVTVCVWRHPADARRALERWYGSSMDDERWVEMVENARSFADNADLLIDVAMLEYNDYVVSVLEECGIEPDHDLIKTFQLLKIEEHLEKAKQLHTE